MNKKYLNSNQIKGFLLDVIRQMAKDEFKPDIVIGLVRGGSLLANYVSQFYDIPCYMYNKETEIDFDLDYYNNVLVIDDINDSGKALTNINNILFNHPGLKYATLISNESSSFEVDYSSYIINRFDCTDWFVFPWENWWMTDESNTDPSQ